MGRPGWVALGGSPGWVAQGGSLRAGRHGGLLATHPGTDKQTTDKQINPKLPPPLAQRAQESNTPLVLIYSLMRHSSIHVIPLAVRTINSFIITFYPYRLPPAARMLFWTVAV